MTTPVTDLLNPGAPSTGPHTGLLDVLGGNTGTSSSVTQSPIAQVQATPGVTPDAAPPFGDASDWGRWGAVAVGTTYAGVKVQTNLTPEKQAMLEAKYRNVIRFQGAPTAVQERVKTLQAARGAAPSTLSRVKEGTAGARSVFSKFGANTVNKVASKVPLGRTTVNLASGAARAVAGRMGPKAAAIGMRLGARLALFAIPGPGWVLGAAVFAASWLFDSSMRRFMNNLVGKVFGVNNSPAIDAPPEPPRTQFLPLTHDGDRDSVIDTKDAEMVLFNDAAFAFDPNKIWHPTAPTIENTPTYETTTNMLADLITEMVAIRDEVDAVMRKYRGEQWVDRAGESMKQSLNSLDEFGTTILPALSNLVAQSATDISALYMKLRDANSSARNEISNSGAGLFPWTADVEAGNMGQLPGVFEKFVESQNANIQSVQSVVGNWSPPTSLSPGAGQSHLPGALTSPDRDSTHVPAPGVGGGSTMPKSPSASLPDSSSSAPKPDGNTKSGPSKNDIEKILKDIGVAAPGTGAGAGAATPNPMAQTPNPLSQMGSGLNNPLSGMQNPLSQMGGNPFSAMQNPLGNGVNSMPSALQQPAAAKPDADKIQSKLQSTLRDLMGGDKAKDTVAEKRAAAAKDDEKKDEEKTEDGPAVPAPAPAPAGGDAVKADPVSSLPGPLGAETPPPTAPGGEEPQSRTATIGGKTIEFEDPRSARMAELMHPTDGTSPVTVQEAAKQAGYTLPPAGEPIGAIVPTADLRPGDLIMGEGDRNGVYLGDSKVLTGGEVRPVGDIAHFSGDGQGIFRLEDAGAPASTPTSDSSAQAADGAAPAPAADAAAPAPAPAPAPAGEAAPAAPSTPDSMIPAHSTDPIPSTDPAHPTDPAASTDPAHPAPTQDPAAPDTSTPAAPPADSAMPLPHASTLTSNPDMGSSSPAVPSVPVGD